MIPKLEILTANSYLSVLLSPSKTQKRPHLEAVLQVHFVNSRSWAKCVGAAGKAQCALKSLCLPRRTVPFETVAAVGSSAFCTDNPAAVAPPWAPHPVRDTHLLHPPRGREGPFIL